MGTLGVVLTARRHEVIPKARPIVERLVRQGMHISDGLVREALALVGE